MVGAVRLVLVLVLVDSPGQVPARPLVGKRPLEPGKVPQMAAAERAQASPDESVVELWRVVREPQIPGKISSLRSAKRCSCSAT